MSRVPCQEARDCPTPEECKDHESHPDDWFIEPKDRNQQPELATLHRQALNLCWSSCPFRLQCLHIALTTERQERLIWGIYGGYTEAQRRVILRELDKRENRVA